jgi:radical SAM protein with 4Fe4S-binding SPASM domain
MTTIPAPEVIIWEITRSCNFRCSHCIVDASSHGAGQELDGDECRGLLDQFKALGIKELFLSGGEPFLRKDLVELMGYACKIGIPHFSIASNGSVVKEEKLKKLKEYGLQGLQISIDGATSEQNAKIRSGVPGAFEKALKAVDLCRKLQIPVFIGVFLHPENIDSVPDVITLAREHDVPMVRFSGFVPLGRAREIQVQEQMKFSYPQIARFINFLSCYNPVSTGVKLAFDHAFGPTEENFRCVAGVKSCYIGSEGSVYPCPSFSHKDYLVGSLRDAPLYDIWSKEEMRNFHVSPQKITGPCRECPDLMSCRGGCRGVTYAYTRNIFESFPNCLRRYSRIVKGSLPAPVTLSEGGKSLKPLVQRRPGIRSALNMFYEEHRKRLDWLLQNHPLSYLLWESTLNCNLKCRHCAVPRETWKKGKEMGTVQVKQVLQQFAEDFPVEAITALAISGGEPLLRKDIFEIIAYATQLGFKVGIDSNGFLMGRDTGLIDSLVEAGLWLPSLSLDGPEEHHNFARGVECFQEVVKAITCFVEKYPHLNVQTVTMVTRYNLSRLSETFSLLEDLGVRTARFGTVIPLGRAPRDPMNFLLPGELSYFLQWIAQKKKLFHEGKTRLFIDFTDDGWCGRACDGIGLEGLVRETPFICSAGVTMGTIYYDGMLGACLSIPTSISCQGSLLQRRPKDLWEREFKKFRDKSWLHQGHCLQCGEWAYCGGGGIHQHDETGGLRECTYLKLREIFIHGQEGGDK